LQSPERVGGRGLANMRRRAQSLGADLEIGPIPNGGTRVVVRLPVSGVAMA
jgi:signal transduction histidine kinase